jgi:hypothetical protein
MIRKYTFIGLFVIILTTPALLNAAPIIEGQGDALRFLEHSSGGPLMGSVEMDGVLGINTPDNDDVFLFSFNGFGETFLEFETGNLVSLVDGVYTWEGGGSITQRGALGLGPGVPNPNNDLIVPDITFLMGDWTGPITGQIEDSDFVIRGSGTDVKDQTLLDFYGIAAADNSWQFSFELPVPLEDLGLEPDGGFAAFSTSARGLSFSNINTAAAVSAPMTHTLFSIGLVALGFCNYRLIHSELA